MTRRNGRLTRRKFGTLALTSASLAACDGTLRTLGGAPSPAPDGGGGPIDDGSIATRPPPGAPSAPSGAGLWKIVPYSETTAITLAYYDGLPQPIYSGPYAGRAPNGGSKHMRASYRPSNGRLYLGGGDWGLDSNGYDLDAGPSSANSVLWSYDPSDPNHTLRQETHRYSRDLDVLLPAGIDQSAISWDTTRDVLMVMPVTAFDAFNFLTHDDLADPDNASAPLLIPRYVSPTQIEVSGDWRAFLWPSRRIGVHLDHPAFPTYTPDQRYGVPCWMIARCIDVAFDGASTRVTFVRDPQELAAVTRPLAFDRDGKGLILAGGPSAPRDSRTADWCWLDNNRVYVDEATGKHYAGVLEWDPAGNGGLGIFTRRNFELGRRYKSDDGLADLGPLLHDAFFSRGFVFVPAASTGRGDELVAFYNIGDGGWFGCTIYDLATNRVDMFVNAGPGPGSGELSAHPPTLDPIGRKLYHTAPAEKALYELDLETRIVRRVAVDFTGEEVVSASNDATGAVWNEDLGMVECYMSRSPYNGEGVRSLYLVDPSQGHEAHRVGYLLPGGASIRGNEWFRVPGATHSLGAQGGGTVELENGPDRHIFLGGNLRFQELTVAPHRRLISSYGDEAASNAATAQTRAFVPYRAWGGFVVGRDGRAYYLGGGHGDYHGTEVDTCDLSAVGEDGVMPWRQNIGPTRDGGTEFPPHGDPEDYQRSHTPSYPTDLVDGLDNSGYGNAGSNWMWMNPATPGAWQHDAIHMYANATTHPTLGLFMLGNVPTDLLMPASRRDHTEGGRAGLKSWSAITGKWSAHANDLPFDGNQRAPGDWNVEHGYYLTYEVESSRDRVRFQQWSPERGLESAPLMSREPGDTVHHATNGACLWLEGHRFLIVKNNLGGGAPKMWLYEHSLTSPVLTDVTPELWSRIQEENAENGYLCADPDHRKVWLLEGRGEEQARLYYAAYESPTDFRRLRFVDTPSFRPPANSIVSAGIKGLQYWGGYLWTVTQGDAEPETDGRTGRTRFWRMPVF
jgi:hypothetical protein